MGGAEAGFGVLWSCFGVCGAAGAGVEDDRAAVGPIGLYRSGTGAGAERPWGSYGAAVGRVVLDAQVQQAPAEPRLPQGHPR